MALVYKVRFAVTDEDGETTVGTSVGGDDVRALVKVFSKKYKDSQFLYLELVDAWDDEVDDYDPGDEGIEVP